MIMRSAAIPILLYTTALAVLFAFLSKAASQPSTLAPTEFYPNVPEEEASGIIRDIIDRNSRRFHTTLIVYNTSDIEFASVDSRIMTPRTRQKLHALSTKVQSYWRHVKLRVLKSWTDQQDSNEPKSLHYEGRASDFVTSDNDEYKLGILAGLAVEVGFDWVQYAVEENSSHIHGSVLSEVCQSAVDLLFILDGSGSVKLGNFRKAKDFIKNVIDFFDIGMNGTRIAVIQYSNDVHVEFKLNAYHTTDSLKKAIDRIPYRNGYTNTPAALNAARQIIFQDSNGARPSLEGIPRIAVLMTDGKSNRGDLDLAVKGIRDTNINVFVIGIGNIDIDELNFIASPPVDQHFFLLDSFKGSRNRIPQ